MAPIVEMDPDPAVFSKAVVVFAVVPQRELYHLLRDVDHVQAAVFRQIHQERAEGLAGAQANPQAVARQAGAGIKKHRHMALDSLG